MPVSQITDLSVADLLSMRPEEGADWLKQVEAGRRGLSGEFNWHGLAFGAADNAKEPTADSHAWARLAVAIYERLTQRTADESARFSFLLAAMLVRARMIGLLGPRPADSVLDPSLVFDWFLGNLSMTPEEAARRSATWERSSIEEIGALRRVKNRLGVVKYLCECQPALVNEAVAPWLALHEKLP